MLFRSPLLFAFGIAVCTVGLVHPAIASENAVLSTGFRLRIDRHESGSGVVRLYSGQSVTELPANAVAGFETLPDAAPVPPEEVQEVRKETPSLPKALPTAHELLRDAAAQAGLPMAFVESVAKVESGFRNDAVSPKGALGMMQLMPETARRLSADPQDPVQNTQAGARLLRELLIRYNGDVPKALAAYNAGTEAVDRYHGIPEYAETQNYVNQVIRNYIKAGGK